MTSDEKSNLIWGSGIHLLGNNPLIRTKSNLEEPLTLWIYRILSGKRKIIRSGTLAEYLSRNSKQSYDLGSLYILNLIWKLIEKLKIITTYYGYYQRKLKYINVSFLAHFTSNCNSNVSVNKSFSNENNIIYFYIKQMHRPSSYYII